MHISVSSLYKRLHGPCSTIALCAVCKHRYVNAASGVYEDCLVCVYLLCESFYGTICHGNKNGVNVVGAQLPYVVDCLGSYFFG